MYGQTRDTLKTNYTFSVPHETNTFFNTEPMCQVPIGERLLADFTGTPVLIPFTIPCLKIAGNPFYDQINIMILGYFIDVDWMYGQLLSKDTFACEDGKYDLVERIENYYETTGFSSINTGLYNHLLYSMDEPIEPVYGTKSGDFYYFNIYRYTGRSLPLSTTVTKYFDTGNVVEETRYTYPKKDGRIFFGLPQTEAMYVEDEKVRSRKYEYPFDRFDSVAAELTRRNAIAKPLKTELFEGDISVAALETVYARECDLILPESERLLFGGGIADRYDYHAYDAHGNPACVSRNGVMPTVYIWSHGWTEPVAEIRNATCEAVQRLDTANMLQRIGARVWWPEHTEEMEWLESLQARLPESEVRLFTYFPMIGLRSVRDPSGRTIRYEYDPANRLRSIRDEEDRILETYRYHYRNR